MDYLYALQNIRDTAPSFVNYFFVLVSEIILKTAVILSAIIYWCLDKENGAFILLSYSSAYSVNQVVKNTACVYRPWIRDSRLHIASQAAKGATGYSFPSGHTVTAASIFGGISIWKKQKKGIVALMISLIVLTAFSRNWLGAHTIQDVLVAILNACIVLCISIFVRAYIEKKPNKDLILTILMILLSLVVILYLQFKKYPVDYAADGTILVDPYDMLTDCYTACGMVIGGFVGWLLERRFVKFTTDVTLKTKIIRSIFGIIIFAIIYFVFGPLLKPLGTHFAHLVKYGFLFFALIFLYPLAFNKIEKMRK